MPGAIETSTGIKSTSITVRVGHTITAEVSPTELQAQWQVYVRVDGVTQVRLAMIDPHTPCCTPPDRFAQPPPLKASLLQCTQRRRPLVPVG